VVMERSLVLGTIFTQLQKIKKLPQKSLNSKNTASTAVSTHYTEKANNPICFQNSHLNYFIV